VGHQICAIVIAGPFHASVASTYDLVPVSLAGLTLFHITHYWSAYWQSMLGATGTLDNPPDVPGIWPHEAVTAQIVASVAGRAPARFAIIQTDFFGGVEPEWAAVYTGTRRESPDAALISHALRMLGVSAPTGTSEFEYVGLEDIRRTPEWLDKYEAMCEERGV
jgi:hypothetical protein